MKQGHQIIKDLTVANWMINKWIYVLSTNSMKEAAKFFNKIDADFITVIDNGKPIGIITGKSIVQAFLDHGENMPVTEYMSRNHFQLVHADQFIIDVCKLPSSNCLVVDDEHRLIGILTSNEIQRGLVHYINELDQSFHSAEIVEVILESAYEGVAMVDRNGIIVEFNEAYSRFTGVDKKDAIGHPVQEVIENTNLHRTVKTGIAERGVIQYIQGQPMVVHRIPVWRNGELVGAIGMLIFEGVTELYQIYDRYQEKKQKMKNEKYPKKEISHQLQSDNYLEQIIGQSEELAKLKRMTRKVAQTEATVLITGDSGTGKELFVKSIHHLSDYKSGPFVCVNCGAIPEQLFESELFGYEDGSFTGAKRGGKIGKFKLADNGTLFLDEIGEMPLTMQTKLLRVIQEKEYEKVGGLTKQPLKARVVAATNRNLKVMVEKGTFREDLYYRINVIELHIPPLRKRERDIPLLISSYLLTICKKYNIQKKDITAEAMGVLMKYKWYGNIRELINTIEKLVILTEGDMIHYHHLPNYMKREEFTIDNQLSPMHQVKHQEHMRESELIKITLEQTGGNKTKTAQKLGIHRTTLYQKLKKFGIEM
ncbi:MULTISPECIES: sigma 54-interacting transcriptional regulator [Oceanobacillus]|uniref:Sigma-54-dependent Fis family transcriptional regulator n=1 Tax=Oceanobacillus kimchii TaxID=746691 RepID=A0ABQ5TRI6_9BACI|nr:MULTISPECIES: sigma 54-interacting transcriptional regulator [Oceanobacillus]MBT2600343.1 sigma 54-interacting transcriptional regulator [Oceanobacillus sp. ISL-74]MBT2650501.1 sigma 54-interacting transcriptional regulator [Oceanobacillus sp. ISL-73]GLO67392.1 sigma-54-dependent Fis family transcriptional regulator [Oceanobacillus kimchii]